MMHGITSLNASIVLLLLSPSNSMGSNVWPFFRELQEKCPDGKPVKETFYEIILAFTSDPVANCSDAEDAEIAQAMQMGIQTATTSLFDVKETKNIVCSRSFARRRDRNLRHDDVGDIGGHSNHSNPNPMNQRELSRRKFIFLGGGRCRFCNRDNHDHRWLGANPSDDLIYVSAEGESLVEPKEQNECPFQDADGKPESDGWVGANAIAMSCGDKQRPVGDNVLGPIKPGNQIYRVFKVPESRSDTNTESVRFNLLFSETGILHSDTKREGMIEKGGLWFMINNYLIRPTDDLKPRNHTIGNRASKCGKNPNGIHYCIYHNDNYGAGTCPFGDPNKKDSCCHDPKKNDRLRLFELYVPRKFYSQTQNQVELRLFVRNSIPATANMSLAMISFEGTEQFDLHYAVKRTDQGHQNGATFEQFKAIAELRIKESIVTEISNAFYAKEGHCMHNKLPMVVVTFVEKNRWNAAKPRC